MLYHERWEEELTIDELKTHQRERPVLRSQTPGGVVQELYGLLLGHYVIRVLMQEAAASRRDRPATALVHRGVEDPAVSVARVPGEPPGPAAVVSRSGGRGRRGSAGGASRPDQPPGDQAEDEQLEEEAARASPLSSAHQGIYRRNRHAPLNGIGLRGLLAGSCTPPRRETAPPLRSSGLSFILDFPMPSRPAREVDPRCEHRKLSRMRHLFHTCLSGDRARRFCPLGLHSKGQFGHEERSEFRPRNLPVSSLSHRPFAARSQADNRQARPRQTDPVRRPLMPDAIEAAIAAMVQASERVSIAEARPPGYPFLAYRPTRLIHRPGPRVPPGEEESSPAGRAKGADPLTDRSITLAGQGGGSGSVRGYSPVRPQGSSGRGARRTGPSASASIRRLDGGTKRASGEVTVFAHRKSPTAAPWWTSPKSARWRSRRAIHDSPYPASNREKRTHGE